MPFVIPESGVLPSRVRVRGECEWRELDVLKMTALLRLSFIPMPRCFTDRILDEDPR